LLSVSFLAIQFVFVVSVSWRALVLPHRADQGFDRFAINHAIFLTANVAVNRRAKQKGKSQLTKKFLKK
tara:strand:- start:150 stop:356 length:207 start_codon:yes stop_codon:yes gene_type:complete